MPHSCFFSFRRFSLLAALALGACATTRPPSELVQARESYQRAQSGVANTVMPAELYSDKHYLDSAEASFKEEPQSTRTKDLSYIALRKIEGTESRARTQQYMKQKDESEAAFQARMRSQLKSTKEQLAKTSQQMALDQSQLNQTREQLEQEKQARALAEQQRAAAELTMHDALAKIAQVKEEARGTVITLSGSVLFQSGKSDLLPAAQSRLGPVADALQGMPNRKILVQGHTDSRGSADHNQQLSVRRADTVRTFLVDHGIDAARVRSEGLGPTQPVADNTSAEGRANNRRVEIILERPAANAAMAPATPATDSTAAAAPKARPATSTP